MTLTITTTLRRGALLGLALLLCAGSASAQLYKWTDANGKLHFSDTPPPDTGKVSKVKGANGGADAPNLPYTLSNAMRNHPVTLYTSSACTGCDAGRSYLREHGIPYAEKTVNTNADIDRLKAAGGDGSLPYITVGSAKMAGFEAGAWDAMLKNAQYPSSKMLPPGYQFAGAVAAAPVAPKPSAAELEAQRRAAAERTEQNRAPAAPEASPTAPPGFRF